MNTIIIIGSIRTGRQSHKVAYYLKKELSKHGVETNLIDLAEKPLPLLQKRVKYDPESPENAVEISNQLKETDAILLITPEYHGSFSGVLKNAMDYFGGEFRKKPIGVVAVSTGRMAGINASNQLQHVILSIGAYPLPQKLLLGDVKNAFNDTFEPQDNEIIKSTHKFLDEFLWLADALLLKKHQDEQDSLRQCGGIR